MVMTGMGADGREGAAWIKAQGRPVLTEAEATCVVYGMPRSVVEAGLSDEACRSTGWRERLWSAYERQDTGRRRFGPGAAQPRQMLEAAGYAWRGGGRDDALERYFLEKPDLVLLDLVMKGMYGLEVLAKLRELDAASGSIVVSADIQTSSHEMVRAGATAFVNKPFDRRDLLNAVTPRWSGPA